MPPPDVERPPLGDTASILRQIDDVGRDQQRGGYSRPGFSMVDRELLEWYVDQLRRRGLDADTDRNGIVWAWWNPSGLPLRDAVVTGSHLDSVPGGGPFDGPLGIASALRAVDLLQSRRVVTQRPLGLAVFPEEEGSRFGVACLGSRLLTGAIAAERALALTDAAGITLRDAAARAGVDPRHMGPDSATLEQIGTFVELHVEQGRGLIDLDQPVAIGTSVLAHGRWRVSVQGQGNHAGTTLIDDRRDPLLVAAAIVTAVRRIAVRTPGARATVGRLEPLPGGTNVIASRVNLWLDVRHDSAEVTAALVAQITAAAREAADAEGCIAEVHQESISPTVHFDQDLRGRLRASLPHAPLLATGAGHDAAVLAERVPTAMLFTRNPTGISHSSEEYVEDCDAEQGSVALAQVLEDLLTA